MTKKHFIALADAIREHNTSRGEIGSQFGADHLDTLAHFCKAQNMNFNMERWLEYIQGKCGPNGGAIKAAAKEDEVLYYTDNEGFEVWSG